MLWRAAIRLKDGAGFCLPPSGGWVLSVVNNSLIGMFLSRQGHTMIIWLLPHAVAPMTYVHVAIQGWFFSAILGAGRAPRRKKLHCTSRSWINCFREEFLSRVFLAGRGGSDNMSIFISWRYLLPPKSICIVTLNQC